MALTQQIDSGVAASDFSDAEIVRSFLERALERSGLNAGQLAKRVGVAATTLYRPLKGEGAANMGYALLRRISRETGEPLPEAGGSVPGFAQDATPAPTLPDDLRERRLVADLAPGARNASIWTVRTAALLLAGIVPGDRVILDPDAGPRPGDAVIAQLYDWESGTAQTVLRLYQPPYLVAAAADALQFRPIMLDSKAVGIKGAIVARFSVRR